MVKRFFKNLTGHYWYKT